MEKEKIILLVGKTGAGKSSIGNILLGKDSQEKFEVGHSLFSETSESKSIQSVLRGTQMPVKIIDTVGFGDNRRTMASTFQTFVDLLNQAKHGVDIVLFCCERLDRATDEIQYFEDVLLLFGRNIRQNIVFVITKMDRCVDDEEQARTQETYQRDLPKLLQKKKIFVPPILFVGGKSKTMTENFVNVIEKILAQSPPRFVREDLQKIHSGLDAFNNESIARANQRAIMNQEQTLEMLLQDGVPVEDEYRIAIQECLTIHQLQVKLETGKSKEIKIPEDILKFSAEANPKVPFYQALQKFFISKETKDESTLAGILKAMLQTYANSKDKTWTREGFEHDLKQYVEKSFPQKLVSGVEKFLEIYLPPKDNQADLSPGKVSGKSCLSWWDMAGGIGSGTAGGVGLGFWVGSRFGQFLVSFVGSTGGTQAAAVISAIGVGSVVISGVLGLIGVFFLGRSLIFTKEGAVDSVVEGTMKTLLQTPELGDFIKIIIFYYYYQRQKF